MSNNKFVLIYLYKRKYTEVDKLLNSLPSYFKVINSTVTPSRAKAFSIACVPAIIVLDDKGTVVIKREGLSLVKDYLNQFSRD